MHASNEPTPDGFPGDEDNGTTAAWYVLSTLGIYDICPGKNETIRIPMLCKRARVLGQDVSQIV